MPTHHMASPPPMNHLNNSITNEKQNGFYQPSASPAPPPAYGAPPAAASIASASALYEYHPSDAGDLHIQPNDRIAITEFMNADWAKGRNERTGQEGIFPRSYVNILDEKNMNGLQQQAPPSTPSNYGNMPLDVSQGGGGPTAGGPNSKLNQNGKKFGKKLGNAGKSRSRHDCDKGNYMLTRGSDLRRWRHYWWQHRE